MQAILNSRPPRVYFAIRIFFVVLLAASSIGKLMDMTGFYKVIDSYQALPAELVLTSAWGLALFELGLAFSLALSKHLKAVAATLVLLHGLYFLWLSLALIRGQHIPNCGCFGVYFARPLTGFTLLEDGFLLFLSALLWRRSRTQTP